MKDPVSKWLLVNPVREGVLFMMDVMIRFRQLLSSDFFFLLFAELTWANQVKESGKELFTAKVRLTLCPTIISFMGSISNLLWLSLPTAVLMLSKSQPWWKPSRLSWCLWTSAAFTNKKKVKEKVTRITPSEPIVITSSSSSAKGWDMPTWQFLPSFRQISTLMVLPSHRSRFPQLAPDSTWEGNERGPEATTCPVKTNSQLQSRCTKYKDKDRPKIILILF